MREQHYRYLSLSLFFFFFISMPPPPAHFAAQKGIIIKRSVGDWEEIFFKGLSMNRKHTREDSSVSPSAMEARRQ